MNNFNILLYSKYSNNSTRLLELLKMNNIKDHLNLNLLCIDNENIRKRIKLSDVEITNVPCLLVVVNKIQIEKYEGQQLHDWIISNLQSNPQLMMQPQHQPPPQMMHHQPHPQMMHHQPPPQMMHHQPPPQMMHQQPPPQMMHHQPPQMMHQQPPPQMMQQQPPPPQMMHHQPPPQMMEPNHPPQMMEQNQLPPPPQMMMEQRLPPQMMMEQPMMDLLDNDLKNKDVTSIEGIVIEDEDDSVKIPKKKKDSKYNNFSNNYDEYEQKNKKKEQKKLDLLNSAMQMKKAREDEDKSINNVYTKL